MKVLVLLLTIDVGGTAAAAASLAQSLIAEGWEAPILVPLGGAALVAWLGSRGVAAGVHRAVPDLHDRRGLEMMGALGCLVRQHRPDVVNIHYGGTTLSARDMLAVRLAGMTKCVASVHHAAISGPVTLMRRLAVRIACSVAASVVVPSAATRATLLRSGAPANKIRIVPIGVPGPVWTRDRKAARARLGLHDTDFVIGSLSRLEPEKGIDTLIEAAAQLADPQRQLRVLIGGAGSQQAMLERMARERLGDRARLLGHVPESSDLYAALDLFVLPSHMEGFGLVFIEAALHKVPSVATHVGSVPEVVTDGRTGLLVAPGDAAALAVAIARLRDDAGLRRRFGQAAHDRAWAQFTEAAMADQYAQVFRA